MERTGKHRVICFGEVLWDFLPSGAVPGGAPMNVTWHLHKLRKNPAIITRIGADEKGIELRDIFSARGVCTDYFQVDPEYETGKVFARENPGHEMVYDIVFPVAWDFIQTQASDLTLVSEAAAFVFGSLAARNAVSKNSLWQLLEAAGEKVLDINLRAPHYSQTLVEELMRKADLLKLNQEELHLITGWYNRFSGMEERIKMLSDQFHIPTVVVTMGGRGAILYRNGQFFQHPGFQVQVQDTVGSGDAFLAGLLSQFMEGAPPEEALYFANGLGAFIATQRGACPDYDAAGIMDSIRKMNHAKTTHLE